MLHWILNFALALPAAPAQTSTDAVLALSGARVLAEDGTRWLEDATVLLRGERITQVATIEEAGTTDAPTLDLAGLYLTPGLIDLHSHLLLHPYDEASWNDQVLRESLELRTIRAVPAALATLEAGFTTLRELGTEGAGYADVALRDAIDQGIIPGPRIYPATRALVASGCYGPSGFDPRWEMPVGAQVADGPAELRRAVRQQIAAGASWIKVYADYRRRPGDPASPTFSPAELEAIVDEARSAGLPVAAHATTDAAIRRAVEAGVQTIEHGTQASLATLKTMREHGAVLCPTVAASEAMARYAGWKPGTVEPERVLASRALIARALEAGVTIACASDVGVFSHGDSARELELLVEYGLSPTEALRAATTTAAAVLGAQSRLGRIAPDFAADLVAFERDPLQDPANLRDPVLVIARGRLVHDRRP